MLIVLCFTFFYVNSPGESKDTEGIFQHNEVYNKPTGNIKLNEEKLKIFPLKSEIISGCLILLHSI